MELRHLRYFVAVAEELHFGRAAARLHLSQPPLSQQIRALERELGLELLHRTRRRVALTDAGRTFLDGARDVLDRVARATAAAQRVARGEVGAVEIGFVASATHRLVPTIVRRLRRRHPGVILTLSEMSTGEQVAALQARRIELGLARPPVGDPTLVAEDLGAEPLAVALPAGHPLARRRAVRLPELAGEPFVLFPREPRPGWADLVRGACRAAGFEPRAAQETLELSTALALVAAGAGVSLVPASARLLRRPGVVHRDLAPPVPTTRLVALRRPGPVPPALASVLAVVHEAVAAERAGR